MPPFVLLVLKITLLLLLYIFIWRAVRAVTKDLYRTGAPARPARGGRPARQARGTPTRVLVMDERGSRVGQHKLSGTLQIGRADSCHIRISDSYASQVHAKLYERNGTWVVEDMGSTNGTYLNQRKVTVPSVIGPGDRIRIGKTTIEVRR